MHREYTLSDFDFSLPPELIAQRPLAERTASRLLHVGAQALQDLHFAEVENLIRSGDVLVFNNTRVLKARLFGRKPSGGKVELLIERVLGTHQALALLRSSHPPQPGQEILLGEPKNATPAVVAVVRGRQDNFFVLEFNADVLHTLETFGHLPLPPYIQHSDANEDLTRYQTVYASAPGAVAAPTAGLHFSEALLERLRQRGVQLAQVTLHVGAGTFQPVRTDDLRQHVMHRERYVIDEAAAQHINSARTQGARVIAVGTTSLRALESNAQEGKLRASSDETALFITPGYKFQIVDRLITNFHLPKSTLFMLVCAFAGFERMHAAYAHAIATRYRFFSYGDAMWLER